MKSKTNIRRTFAALHQSKWVLRVLMTLVLLMTVISVNGCQPHH